MRASLVLLTLLAFACEKQSSAPDDRSPLAAARCQTQAIQSKSVTSWLDCFHPDLREQVGAALAKKPPDWADLAVKNQRIEKATEASFELETPTDTRRGDQHARLRLDDDSFEVARLAGRWYIVDSGL
ncbi:MAG: hypothetical protein ACKV2T_39940 [Kofleriaceae bacterium]